MQFPKTLQSAAAAQRGLFVALDTIPDADKDGYPMQSADRIAVVADARIGEIGTHDELMALNGHYAALVNNWNKSQPN